jgi:parvulin-like peptidyl-prolyl isomerase
MGVRSVVASLLLALLGAGVVSPAVGMAESSPPPRGAAAEAAPAAVPPDEIGIIDGIPITQAEWDRLAKPYFEEVQARAGRPLNDDEKRLLQHNVLDELVRERLWLADARRRGMKVADAEIDSRMKQSAFFKTAGKLDEAKFQAFKSSPTSNYGELRAQVERTLVLEEYARWMERRFGPREAELKKTFEERTTLASIRFAVVGPEAVSLEPQATPAQVRAYYEAHPDEFMGAEEARIRYVRVPATSEGASSDSAKEAASRAALQAASGLLTELKSGASAETLAKPYGGIHDSGWFRAGDPVRGLGRSDALTSAVRASTPGEWIREPLRIGPHYVLVHVEERRGAERLPFREVAAQAKRKADAEVREEVIDSLAIVEVREHRQNYYVPRVTVAWISRGFDTFDPGKPPGAKEVGKRLEQLRRDSGVPDTARAWADSVRAGVPDLIRWERRRDHAARTFREIMSRLGKREDPAKVARRYAAKWGVLTRYRGEPPTSPSLVEGALLDTLYSLRPMDVLGPRQHADSVFAVRVERLDPAFLPPFEASRPAAHAAVLEARRQAVAREAEAYFREHKGSYRTSTRWIIDYALFRKAKPEDVTVPQDTIAAYWRDHPLEFTEPGKARVRHVLVALPGSGGAAGREAARQRALAARKRVADGEEFAAVAREVSDDTGSNSKGGELGELTRGSVVKEFADVAFTIPAGELSPVFETKYGFHFLQVESRTPERLRPLAECAEEIHGVIGRDLADSAAFRSAAEFLAGAARSGPPADSSSARRAGWTRTPPVSGNETLGPLGPALWLEKAVASLADGALAPTPIALAEGYVAVRRIREVPPAQATFDQVRDRVIADFQLQRRREVADSLDQILRAAFGGGADPETLFLPVGGLRLSRQFGRQGPIPDLARDASLARDSTYLSRVFATEAGGRLPPFKGNSGTLYAVVDTVIVLPPAEFAKNRDALLHELIDQRVEAWTARLRSKAPIRIHRKDLRAALG